ncbi:unnamed protein product [Larinioides sclopetarius]|uniref:Uncharacterized protein n=1 Tax=Larinioides sclopetarius TaxID=280406 RepID=A0AAV2B844_9ARAC
MEKTSNMKRIITCVRVIYYFALLFTLFEKGMSDKALRYIQCTAGETVKEIYSFICDEKNPYIVLDCVSFFRIF